MQIMRYQAFAVSVAAVCTGKALSAGPESTDRHYGLARDFYDFLDCNVARHYRVNLIISLFIEILVSTKNF